MGKKSATKRSSNTGEAVVSEKVAVGPIAATLISYRGAVAKFFVRLKRHSHGHGVFMSSKTNDSAPALLFFVLLVDPLWVKID